MPNFGDDKLDDILSTGKPTKNIKGLTGRSSAPKTVFFSSTHKAKTKMCGIMSQ